MNLKSNLTENELNLLKKANINVKDKDYTFEEIDNIIEKLDLVILSSLDENENFTKLSIEYEKIQDKLLDLESD